MCMDELELGGTVLAESHPVVEPVDSNKNGRCTSLSSFSWLSEFFPEGLPDWPSLILVLGAD
jgi:hypothetical protein